MRATQSSTSAYGKNSFTGSSGETPTAITVPSMLPEQPGISSGSAPASLPRWLRSPLARVLPIHPEDVIASCAGLLHQAAGRPVAIGRPSTDRASVTVCAEVLERILLNLVRNAGAATASTGSISIRSHVVAAESCVAITVEDTGCGISRAELDRVGALSARHSRGGIGLAVVRMLTAGSGGAVRIVSREGTGTRVEVFFPTLEHHHQTLESALHSEASDPLAGGAMIWLCPGPASISPVPQSPVRPWPGLDGHQHNGRTRGGKTVSYVV